MNILITGSNSFICRSILDVFLKRKDQIKFTYHKTLNLLNFESLNKFFNENNNFDFVINFASIGGRRNKIDNYNVFYENIKMLQNLLFFKNHYKNLITFTSGRELSDNNVFYNKENNYTQIPENFYGLSKFVNTQILKRYQNVLNLRLFNVFSPVGMEDSFIYTAINNYINNKPIEIFTDIYFDTFFYEDLCQVINHFLDRPTENYDEYNVVYAQKYKLSDITKIINNLNSHKVSVIIKDSNKKTTNYCGDGSKLAKLDIKFDGLEDGIKEMYEEIKKEKSHVSAENKTIYS